MSNGEMKTILDAIGKLDLRVDSLEKRVIGLEERVSERFDRLETRMAKTEFFMQGLSVGKALSAE